MSNSSDSDQARHLVGPDLDPNCLQRLSADGTSWQRVNKFYYNICLECFTEVLGKYSNIVDTDPTAH